LTLNISETIRDRDLVFDLV